MAVCVAAVPPQVLEDSADDLRVFDAGDDLILPAAVFAALDLDAEDPFEALRPSRVIEELASPVRASHRMSKGNTHHNARGFLQRYAHALWSDNSIP